MNSELITKEVIDGVTYFSTVRRGVEYCARFSEIVGKWVVSTHRKGMSRTSTGFKYIARIEDCKAFAALPALLEMKAI
jgi:hypothetical protein